MVNKNTDEDFFHLVTEAYLIDPVKLAELISDLPGEDVLYLAKAISYDLQKTGRVNQATIPSNCPNQTVSAVCKLICAQAGNPANASMTAFYDEDMLLFIEEQNAYGANEPSDSGATFSVSNTSFRCVPFEYSTSINVSFKISSDTTSSERYVCQVFVRNLANNNELLIGSKAVTKPANSTEIAVVMYCDLYVPGEYSVYMVVSDFYGNSIEVSRSNSVTVTGRWTITVELQADRLILGEITLYDGGGFEISSSICIGLSQNNTAMNLEDGNTPIGVYDAHIGEIDANTGSYGPYRFIRIDQESGYAKTHCSHRTKLLIHGGDPAVTTYITYPLRPTNGCIRITNDYQNQLTSEIDALISNHHYTHGRVIVTQDGLTEL